ncbi:serine hydrolase domain-containing protein [Clostridium sp. D53t1_180928_C8]|uniref:serine hydrolase n=1 Tax=Clostridium sp. D53t1_180928_C8 TaxID=2787101 RepID=UPI0018A93CD4
MSEKIEKLVKEELENGNLAGVSIYAVKDGKEVFSKQFGYSNLEEKIEIKRDTIFNIYSMTKPITAAAAMICVERRLFSLDTPVSKFLDGFKNQKVLCNGKLEDVHREVVIKDLLTMTSGVAYPSDTEVGIKVNEVVNEAIEKELMGKPLKTIEFCNKLGQVPLEFQPGEKWAYGFSADILGAVIEVVSGKKYRDFLKDEFFKPLEMIDTDFYVPEEKWNRFAKVYEYFEEEPKLRPYNGYNLAIMRQNKLPGFESGGAGLVSTYDDYLHFDIMLINDGIYKNNRILSKESIEFMRTNHLNEEQIKTYDWEKLKGYGYGALVKVLKDKNSANTPGAIGQFGWGGWAGTESVIDPENNTIILYFIQRINKDDTVEINIRNQIYKTYFN